MDREDYIAYLQNQNGYCECPELAELTIRGKRVASLADICGMFQRNMGLEVLRQRDLEFFPKYINAIKRFKTAIDVYTTLMNALLDDGVLKARLHRPPYSLPGPFINPKQAREILSEENGCLLTMHCSECEQQIVNAGN
jgi:hypothetical protein